MNRSPRRVLSVVFALCVTASVLGCATRTEVKRIIDDSNQQLARSMGQQLSEREAASERDRLLQAAGVDLPFVDSEGENGLPPGVAATVQSIDEFIAAHPEQAKTNNALIIRKALLLLQNQRPNWARLAFEAYQPTGQDSQRDQAIYEARESLIWWWSVSQEVNPDLLPSAADFERRLSNLTDVVTRNQGSAIAYYLATLRAHVQLKRSRTVNESWDALAAGLGEFCTAFDSEARMQAVALFSGDVTQPIPVERIRWYGQAKVVSDMYAQEYADLLRVLDDVASEFPAELDAGAECNWLSRLDP